MRNTVIGILTVCGIFIILFITNPLDLSTENRCIYEYYVNDVDGAFMGHTHESKPDEQNCIATTTRVFCGTMSIRRTIKDTKRCLPPKD